MHLGPGWIQYARQKPQQPIQRSCRSQIGPQLIIFCSFSENQHQYWSEDEAECYSTARHLLARMF